MIDYFFHFPSEAAAIADASGTQFYTPASIDPISGLPVPGRWFGQDVTPALQVWRPSQDVVTATVLSTDGYFTVVTPATVTHTYLTGWYGCISLPTQVPAIVNHSKLAIAIDRDLAAAGAAALALNPAAVRTPAIIKNNLGALLQDVVFSPVFAGSNYPFGNLQ